MIRRVCVFCGSRSGRSEIYAHAARVLGADLARRDLELVYGGGKVGLMGILADAVLASGGKVTGVIPGGLAGKEIAHTGVTDLRVVASMHERKALMEQLSDAFIALPGGFGTLEEILEITTWLQLGLHRKPAGLLNLEGFYTPLLAQIHKGVAEDLIHPSLALALISEGDPVALLDRILVHQPPAPTVKWLGRGET
jgi:uncharacterized protein (TIGR00730 family)